MLKPKVKMTSDGRFRPLLHVFGDGRKHWGPRLAFDEAYKRAVNAVRHERYHRMLMLGAKAEADERIAGYERKRGITRVYYGQFPNSNNQTLSRHRA